MAKNLATFIPEVSIPTKILTSVKKFSKKKQPVKKKFSLPPFNKELALQRMAKVSNSNARPINDWFLRKKKNPKEEEGTVDQAIKQGNEQANNDGIMQFNVPRGEEEQKKEEQNQTPSPIKQSKLLGKHALKVDGLRSFVNKLSPRGNIPAVLFAIVAVIILIKPTNGNGDTRAFLILKTLMGLTTIDDTTPQQSTTDTTATPSVTDVTQNLTDQYGSFGTLLSGGYNVAQGVQY